MPTAWLPCPGNTNAIVVIGRTRLHRLRVRLDTSAGLAVKLDTDAKPTAQAPIIVLRLNRQFRRELPTRHTYRGIHRATHPRLAPHIGLEIGWACWPPPPAAAFALARSRQLRITTATTRS